MIKKFFKGLNVCKDPIYTLDDIHYVANNNQRSSAKIAVIDDHDFPVAVNLRTHNFNVTEVGDITHLDAIEAYPVIICDIRGVGSKFGSDKEGAYVMHEIRKRYPDKYIVAYSSGTSGLSYQNYLKSADISLIKATPIEVWVDELDKGITTILNPRERWIRLRNKLLNDGLDLYQVHLLQQGYIKSLVNKRESDMWKSSENIEISETLLPIVQTFIAVTLKNIISGL